MAGSDRLNTSYDYILSKAGRPSAAGRYHLGKQWPRARYLIPSYRCIQIDKTRRSRRQPARYHCSFAISYLLRYNVQ